jgi:hypothetical protein
MTSVIQKWRCLFIEFHLSPFRFLSYEQSTVGGQIKLGHLKFNLCKLDHSIVNIFVSVYIICHTKVNLFVTKP